MTPIELQQQAVELLNCLAKEAISPRKSTELANAVKKQGTYLKVKHTDRDVAGNLNYLHNQISKALNAFPRLKDIYPAAPTLLSEIEASVRKITGEFTPPDGKSRV